MVSIQHVPEPSHVDSSLHHFHGIPACDHCAACPRRLLYMILQSWGV